MTIEALGRNEDTITRIMGKAANATKLLKHVTKKAVMKEENIRLHQSGLGGTARRTMLTFVLYYVQAFLGLGLRGDASFPAPFGHTASVTSTASYQVGLAPVATISLLRFDSATPNVIHLDKSFGNPATPATSEELHKLGQRLLPLFSGLGGTARRTMLTFVLYYVQAFLGPGLRGDASFPAPFGHTASVTSTASYQVGLAPVATISLLRFDSATPNVIHLDKSFGNPATPATSEELHKLGQRLLPLFSRLGGTARRTMLTFVLYYVQAFLGPGLRGDASFPAPFGHTASVTSTASYQVGLAPVATISLLRFDSATPNVIHLDKAFGNPATPATSEELHKLGQRLLPPFSGLGGTARRTMLTFVLYYVQVTWQPSTSG
ncbi:uncharacterized protein [Dermacentor albipictus]|uniref:uncharacterized protein isoform X2 n=1 Tax=Dermacentor albipictus TaxID=60249 RepID=UPI0038FCD82E